MKKRVPRKENINSYEHHSNMALLTTVISLITFAVLMLVYIGDHSPQKIELAITSSKVCAVLYWIVAAILAVKAVRGGRKYLAEYVVYMIFIGFGLVFMYNMPMFVYAIIKNTIIATNWARAVFRGLMIVAVLYAGVSIGWHIVLATPRRKK